MSNYFVQFKVRDYSQIKKQTKQKELSLGKSTGGCSNIEKQKNILLRTTKRMIDIRS